jgi:branched-chain amino acid transport system permease protein
MTSWATLALNSITLGGLLFLLSAGFSLIFGLMRIPNLMHGSLFMLGAYLGVTFSSFGLGFWGAALASALAVAALGGLIERVLLRRLAGQQLAQVLLTLGFSFIIADACLMVWTGDPIQPQAPLELRGGIVAGGMVLPYYRIAMVVIAAVAAALLWLLIERTRTGAMIRAAVDDAPIARVTGINVSRLFTLVFCLGAGLAAFAGVIGAPYLSIYPGLDAEMLPLALIVVILGGSGSLVGALTGSLAIGVLYNFGQLPPFRDLSYVILFLPMVIVLTLRPRGLFGRATP